MWKKVVLGVGWCLTLEVPPYNRPDVTIMVDWALKTSSLYPLSAKKKIVIMVISATLSQEGFTVWRLSCVLLY